MHDDHDNNIDSTQQSTSDRCSATSKDEEGVGDSTSFIVRSCTAGAEKRIRAEDEADARRDETRGSLTTHGKLAAANSTRR